MINQVVVGVLGAFAGGLLGAVLFGLLAGVGAYYARIQVAAPIGGRVPAWLLGVAAALATAGIAAGLTALVAPEMPTWPDLKAQAHAWPWAGALSGGLVLIPGVAVTLFLLSVVDRATAGWTRRILVCAVVLVLLAAAAAVFSGHALHYALLQGVIQGLTTFAFAWLLLRYDLRTVPAFVATGLLLDGAASAAIAGTAGAWIMLGLTAVVMIALSWAVMRYLARPLPVEPSRSNSLQFALRQRHGTRLPVRRSLNASGPCGCTVPSFRERSDEEPLVRTRELRSEADLSLRSRMRRRRDFSAC